MRQRRFTFARRPIVGGGRRAAHSPRPSFLRAYMRQRVATHRLVAAAWWFPERKRAHCSALHKAMRTVARAPLMPALQPCGRERRRRRSRRLIGRVDRALAFCRRAVIGDEGGRALAPLRPETRRDRRFSSPTDVGAPCDAIDS